MELDSGIPIELIEDISLRLPVKSLLRFRCVSKSWCSLISSKRFGKAHLEKQNQGIVLVSDSSSEPHIYTLSYYPYGSLFSENSSGDAIQLQFDISEACYSDPRVVGRYNNLCCVFIPGKGFILWNVFTGKLLKLPDWINYHYVLSPHIYGFGFDELNDDYKVYCATYCNVLSHERPSALYSLKTNSWKILELDHVHVYSSSSPGKGQLVNSKLHWAGNNRHRDIINSFDLGNESTGVLQVPSCATDNRHYPILSVLDGCLCAGYHDLAFRGMELWVMKEYGVKESWCKLQVTVPYLADGVGDRCLPLCISRVGEVLLAHHDQRERTSLYIYNPRTCSSRRLRINKSNFFLGIGFYIPSLVSAFLDMEAEEQN